MISVRLLGNPRFQIGDRSSAQLISGRTAALLVYLLIERRPQHRSHLVDLLWDGLSEKKARTNLRYVLRDLRKLVGDYVAVNGETVAFNQELPYWLDVFAFANQTITTRLSSAKSAEPIILNESLNLYEGEFLAGFQIQGAPSFERWMLAQRRRLHELLVQGLQLRTQQLIGEGEYAAGLTLNEALIELEPWREEVHRQRMLLFAHSGQRNAALKQYELCHQLLKEELDVPPMEQTTTLYEQIRSGQWFSGQQLSQRDHDLPAAIASFPKIQTGPAQIEIGLNGSTQPHAARPRWDLDVMPQPAHFYGRQAELGTLHSWMGQERQRLIAILGIDGQGKTALAAALTQDVIETESGPSHGFAHVIWRSLRGGASCTEILHGWLQQLGDTQPDTLPLNLDQLLTRLVEILQERRCLLILDGAEAVLAESNAENNRDQERSRSDVEGYDVLLRTIFQRRHRSCLLLTSSTRPAALTRLDERNGAFRVLNLDGLVVEDGKSILAAHGIADAKPAIQQLHRVYAGNPLVLSRAADLIHDFFDGDATAFLEENDFFLGEVGASLARRLSRLPSLEREIVQALANAGEPLARQPLRAQLTAQPAKARYFQALQNLQRAFLVRLDDGRIALPDLLAAYLAERAL